MNLKLKHGREHRAVAVAVAVAVIDFENICGERSVA